MNWKKRQIVYIACGAVLIAAPLGIHFAVTKIPLKLLAVIVGTGFYLALTGGVPILFLPRQGRKAFNAFINATDERNIMIGGKAYGAAYRIGLRVSFAACMLCILIDNHMGSYIISGLIVVHALLLIICNRYYQKKL